MEKLDDYGEKLMDIDRRVFDRIGDEMKVEFSAFKFDKSENPVDNLDEVPIQGKVKFFRPKGSWSDMRYDSQVMDSPTWLDICVVANDMIRLSGDYHHIFLEAVDVVCEENGVKVAKFSMGS